MKYLIAILLILASCGPTSIEKTSSQGVISGQSDVIMSILLQSQSPSSSPTPSFLIQGNFLIGNTVTLHLNSSCTSPIGNAIAQNTYSVTAVSNPLPQDGLYTFYANVTSRSGSVSGCSTVSASYQYQTGQAPVNLSVLTPSGASLRPIVSVKDIELGASISLYLTSDCTGPLVGQQSFINMSAIQIQTTLPNASQDGPYQFWAKQTLGQVQRCSGPSNTYSLNTKPGYIRVLNPSPGKVFKPTVRVGNGDQQGGALVPGALVKLYFNDPNCSTSTYTGEKQAAPNEISVDINSLTNIPADGTYTYFATQTFNGHISPCSYVYGTYQLKTSPSISLSSPSPSDNPFPEFTVSGMIPGATALLYEGSGCEGTVQGSALATSQIVNVRLSNPLLVSGTHTFSAKQTIVTSRTARSTTSFISSCSNNFAQYIYEAPRVFFTTPSPGNIISPTMEVTELTGSATKTVDVFKSSNCTGSIVASGATADNHIAIPIPSTAMTTDGVYVFSAKLQGSGSCLGSSTYVLDTQPNNFKYVNPTTTTGNIATPTFSVANIANYATPTVTLHTLSDCSDSPVATASGTTSTVNLTLSSPISSEGNKTFYSKQTISGHTPKCSSESISYNYNIVPPTLSIVGQTSGNNPRPTVSVSGIVSGATATIYIDSSCSTPMGSAIASGTSVNIQSNNLPTSSQGAVNFYATQTVGGLKSGCSTAFATYNINTYLSSIKIMTGQGPQTSATGSSNVPVIQVEGFATAASTTVQLFSDSFCSNLVGQQNVPVNTTNPNLLVNSYPLNNEGANLYYARQLIGSYIGPCSGQKNIFATYNLNSTPPPPVLLTASPGTTLTPTVTATNIIPGALIELFIDNKCSIPVGSVTAVTTQVNVQVSASMPLLTDGIYYFYLRQIQNGHISPCSGQSPTGYDLNTKPTGISVVNPPSEILPEPSWNIINPTIRVNGVVPGANVVLYKDSNCTLVIGSGVPNASFVDILVEDGAFPTDGKYALYSRQSFGGHTSYCSGNTESVVVGEYNLNTRPKLSLVGPNPNVLLKPDVTVTNTVNGAFVQLYSSSSCEVGSEISSIYISTGGDQILEVDQGFTVNGVNQIYSKQAMPTLGGVLFQESPCSEALNYTLQATPVISNSTPTPSNISNPSFTLSNLLVESNIGTKTVAIFGDVNCTFQVSPTVQITAPTMTVSIDPIPSVGTYTYFAKQMATDPTFDSPCSSPGATYNYDLTPVVSMVTPSPDDDITPTIRVANLVTGSTVQIYADALCSVFIQNAGVASTNTMDVTLSTELPSDGLYNFYANQTSAGITSTCSKIFANYSLVTNNFQIQPAVPSSTSITPVVIVSNIEAGNEVILYADGNCSTVSSNPQVSIGTSVSLTSYALSTLNVNYQWWAKRKIGSTFFSPCGGPSSTYTLNTMPSSVSLLGSNPGTTLTPTFQVGGVNSNATVTLYSDDTCKVGNERGSAVATSTSVNITLSPAMTADGSITVWARQLSNGNLSPCSSASASYTLDTEPTVLSVVSPGTSSPTPVIGISTVEPGATVNIYVNDPNCNSTIMGTAVVANNSTTVNVTSYPLASDGNYDFYAKQIYPNTNPTFVSGCSSTFANYPLNSEPTGLKLLSTNPTSSSTPKILVEGVAAGDWVYLFKDPACSSVSGSNIALGTSVQIQTLPALTSAGIYQYYAKRIQGGGQGLRSACSSATVDLEYDPSYFSKWQVSTGFTKDPSLTGDQYGNSVATINNYAVVGIPGDNGGRGSVRLYFYDGYSWSFVRSLTNSALMPNDFYGWSVDISASSTSGNITNGDVLIVGAPGPLADPTRAGKAFIYTYSNGSWINESQLNPSGITLGSNFGTAVAINKNMAVVGAPSANFNLGTVRVFRGINGIYTAESIVNPPSYISSGGQFGSAVSAFSTNFVVSAPSGATKTVQTYSVATGTPVAGTALNSTVDEFGSSVDLSLENIIVGAPGANSDEGAVYIYRTTNYSLVNTLTADLPVIGNRFGESVSIRTIDMGNGSLGSLAVIGEPKGGTGSPGDVTIYPGPNFTERIALPTINNDANNQFGAAVSVFGNSIIIGAPGVDPGDSGGAAYLYRDK